MKKSVLITGASRGIGRAIALACARAGYNLVITCHNNIDMLECVAEECRRYEVDCITFAGNIGNQEVVVELFHKITKVYKGIDILINNAGISHVGLLTDMSNDEWRDILSVNLSSVFYCSQLAIPYMVQQKSGKIINISSIWGNVGASCEVAYSATKGGVNSFTKALAKELAPSNIQVNALALGVINTDMNACFSDEEKQMIIDEIPAGRMGEPLEVGRVVVSLLEGHEYLTGQVIKVDGGFI